MERPSCGAGLAFVVFCVLSGAVYLINDLRDLEQDRLHPRKRTRPLASGALPPPVARTAAAVLLLGGLGAALALGPGFAAAALAYVVLEPRVLLRAQERGHPRRPGHLSRLRAPSGGRSPGHRRALQQLAPGLHHPPRAVSLAGQASPRARLARGRGQRSPGHPVRVQPLPARPDDRGGHRVLPDRLRVLHAWPRRRWRSTRPRGWPSPSPSCSTASSGIFIWCTAAKEGGSPTDVLLTDRPLLLAVALWAVAVVVIVYSAPGLPVPRGQ